MKPQEVGSLSLTCVSFVMFSETFLISVRAESDTTCFICPFSTMWNTDGTALHVTAIFAPYRHLFSFIVSFLEGWWCVGDYLEPIRRSAYFSPS